MYIMPEIEMLRTVTFACFLLVFLSVNQQSPRPAFAASEADNLRYISDILVINIRDQLEKPFTVVGAVRSGDPVRVIEEEDTFAKIETADKKRGWISKQYLKSEIPDTAVVQQLRQELADLKKQLEGRPAEDAAIATDKDREAAEACTALEQKLSEAEKQVQQLQLQQRNSATLGAPSDPARQVLDPEFATQLEQTSQRYNQLVIEFEKRGQEIAELQNSMAKQNDTTRFLWFGAGAAVFFLGILAGRSANRKKNKFLY